METNYLELVWMKRVLSDITQFSVFITQNVWVPPVFKTQHLFGLILSHRFHHSVIQENGCEWPKEKTSFTCFQNLKTKFSGKLVNLMKLWALSPVHYHIRNSFELLPLELLCFIFTSLFIPSELAPPPNPTTPNPATPNQPNIDPVTTNPANSISTTNPIITTHHPLPQPQPAHHDSN